MATPERKAAVTESPLDRTPEQEIDSEPFFVQKVAGGWGVFCLDEDRQPDEVTDCLDEPADEALATGICALLNAAYSAGYEAGVNA